MRERGVAIITVLLTVALATIIVSGLLLREHTTVRSVENRLALTQTRWVERAAIDWSKVILAADSRASQGVDHLGEAWAVPVAETRLDETVTAGARIDDDARAATLSGQILDAQARLDVNSLAAVQPDGTIGVSMERLAVLRRLLDVLGQSQALADGIAARVLAAVPGTDGSAALALPLSGIDDLRTVRGMRDETLEALEPFLIFLPPGTVPAATINVNTAPPEVLAAAVEGLDLPRARQLAEARERTFYRQLDDFRVAIVPAPETLSPTLLGTGSSFFIVRGLIRFGRVESFSETLLERQSGNTNRVTVIWQRRL